ncbi:MAG: DNA helicase UvrD, partial [Candidatus Omnitrophica bacterium]|nr:DNA helicase UvrD [Candidatus Omnitrophota bacterium]
MPEFVADFHIHSRYSRACSKDLCVKELAKWAKLKGIGLLGTGDFTHPLWLQELEETLRPTGHGLLEYDGVYFILTTEVNTLFYRRGKAHNIHHVLFAPSFETVKRLNQELESFGPLSLDGRPILRMEAWRLV